MRFTNSELEMIYQYAAPTKAETIGGMKETVPVIKDLLTRVIMENAIEKLAKDTRAGVQLVHSRQQSPFPCGA